MGLPVRIRGIKPEDWAWIANRANPVLCEDTDGIVAVRNGELEAAAVFDSFSETSCTCHLVIENPFVIRHGFLTYGFLFAFIAKDLKLLVGYTPSNNHEALRLNKKLGFRETYRIPEAYMQGVDLVVQEMRRDECRWLNTEVKKVA